VDPIKLLIVLIFVAIVVSLGSALRELARGEGDGRKLVRSLTWRVGLSVALFLLLWAFYLAGLIRPHGIGPS
jgi:O-antigen/teichoic acid export membrane protein